MSGLTTNPWIGNEDLAEQDCTHDDYCEVHTAEQRRHPSHNETDDQRRAAERVARYLERRNLWRAEKAARARDASHTD